MFVTTLHEIVPVLQVATGPVIFISGVGLLLLTMTNRLGRTIDRARHTLPGTARSQRRKTRPGPDANHHHLPAGAGHPLEHRDWQAFSVLLVSALIIILFVGALLDWQAGVFVVLVFIASMVSLFGSLVAFLYDINLALHALRLELQPSSPTFDQLAGANRF